MSEAIESTYANAQVVEPNADFSSKAFIGSTEAYKALYEESIRNPEAFWAKVADEYVDWFEKWDEVLEYDVETLGSKAGPYVSFYKGGKLNVSYNCVDRHVLAGKGDKTAILWQGEKAEDKRSLSYSDLLEEVSRMANVLKKLGVQKGSRVTIYMPMIPEMPIALLACARIGAIHSVVFSAFSPEALKSRMIDCESEFLITADLSMHAGKVSHLKEKADEACAGCPTIERVLVVQQGAGEATMVEGRDFWWHEQRNTVPAECPPEPMDSEDPLFILYEWIDRETERSAAHDGWVHCVGNADCQECIRSSRRRCVLVHCRCRLDHRTHVSDVRPGFEWGDPAHV